MRTFRIVFILILLVCFSYMFGACISRIDYSNTYANTVSKVSSSATGLRIWAPRYNNEVTISRSNPAFIEIVDYINKSNMKTRYGPVTVGHVIAYYLYFAFDDGSEVRFDYRKPELWLITENDQYLASVDDGLDDVLEQLFLSKIFKITKEFWNNEIFTLGGTANLPDGTFLQTELSKNDQPLAWWPVNKYIQVQDGKWEITANIPENEAPTGEDIISERYYLKIWQKNNTKVMAKIRLVWSIPSPQPVTLDGVTRADFDKLKLGMTPAEVEGIVGKPNRFITSGLHQLGYNLEDGTYIVLYYVPGWN